MFWILSAPETSAEGLEFYVRRVSEPKSEVPLTHLLFGLRVSEEKEREGLDVNTHGEAAYHM